MTKNFHAPLPHETYQQLRAAAERTRRPGTTLARQVWLAAEAKATRHQAVAAYADSNVGTEFDLDPDLEATGTASGGDFVP